MIHISVEDAGLFGSGGLVASATPADGMTAGMSLETLGFNMIFDGVAGDWNRMRAAAEDALDGTLLAATGPMVYDRAADDWNRADAAADDSLSGDNIPAVGPMLLDASAGDWNRLRGARGVGDGVDGANQIPIAPWAFNDSTYDRWRNNTETTLLASAARTATTESATQTNYNAKGVAVWWEMTAVPGVETVTLQIRGLDPASAADWYVLLSSGAQSATGQRLFLLYPGIGAASESVTGVESRMLPRTWQIRALHSASGSFTYSVAVAVIL